jgi:Arc/MetJ family transcription regulator
LEVERSIRSEAGVDEMRKIRCHTGAVIRWLGVGEHRLDARSGGRLEDLAVKPAWDSEMIHDAVRGLDRGRHQPRGWGGRDMSWQLDTPSAARIYCADGGYPEAVVTKRLIDVDDDILESARHALGTDTIKDTVNSALRASVQAAERRQRVDVAALKRFAEASRDLLDDDVMNDAWR